jgi:hypothetical protein
VVNQSFVARLLDFLIRHLVPAGEEWLSVKTEPDLVLVDNDSIINITFISHGLL